MNNLGLLLWIFVLRDHCFGSIYDDTAPGAEFDEDLLIGHPSLFDNGAHYERDGTDYYITLLQVEGDTSAYITDQDGYFMGFQWYSYNFDDKYLLHQYEDKQYINFQLYRKVNSLSEDSYMLMNETGWIKAVKGFNIYYFDNPINMANGNDDYFIAFMNGRNNISAVLSVYDPELCYQEAKRVLYAEVTQQPRFSEIVDFSVIIGSDCEVYSLQGIFLPAVKASRYSGNCSMHVAKLGSATFITNTNPYESDMTLCHYIRADRHYYGLDIHTLDFQLQGSWSGDECYAESMQFGDEKSLASYDDFNLWGTFCGTDIFKKKSTRNPYLYIHMSTSSSQGDSGFEFKIVAKENGPHPAAIIAGCVVGAIVLGVIIGIIICCACGCRMCCCSQVKGKVHHTAGAEGNTSVSALTPVQGTTPVHQDSNSGYYSQGVQPSAAPHAQAPQTPGTYGTHAPPHYNQLYSQQPGPTKVNEDHSALPLKE